MSEARTGEGFGEAPMLMGKAHFSVIIEAVKDSQAVQFSEEDFWKLLACCVKFRKVVLGDMARRMQAYQVDVLHREKLVTLGTLAAGLMHELHNPGSAAKRASACSTATRCACSTGPPTSPAPARSAASPPPRHALWRRCGPRSRPPLLLSSNPSSLPSSCV